MKKIIIDPSTLIATLELYANPANWGNLKMYADGGVDNYNVCPVGNGPATEALKKLKQEAGIS